MIVRLWGTRGSLASPGPDTVRHGGNTACVEVRAADGTGVILDAGTGILGLGSALAHEHGRVDVFLTHLHLDHIQGLGFFAPLFQRGREVHIWGPASTDRDLCDRLARYLSPPLFPVRAEELPARVTYHPLSRNETILDGFQVRADRICHPGPTLGYRLTEMATGASVAYLPDHEPALGVRRFPEAPTWTSGLALAVGVDLLIHDAQYTSAEYAARVGWGHSSYAQAVAFAGVAGARRLMPFHHDPNHDDRLLDELLERAQTLAAPECMLLAGAEGASVTLDR